MLPKITEVLKNDIIERYNNPEYWDMKIAEEFVDEDILPLTTNEFEEYIETLDEENLDLLHDMLKSIERNYQVDISEKLNILERNLK